MKEPFIETFENWMKDLRHGNISHVTMKGLKLVKEHKGSLLFHFIVHNALSDENGNWDVSAIATLVDIIGSFAPFTVTFCPQVTLDFSISYYSTAKVQEEIEIEAKVIGKKDELTSVIVEVRKKENGEMVALGKLWMAAARMKPRIQASKL